MSKYSHLLYTSSNLAIQYAILLDSEVTFFISYRIATWLTVQIVFHFADMVTISKLILLLSLGPAMG